MTRRSSLAVDWPPYQQIGDPTSVLHEQFQRSNAFPTQETDSPLSLRLTALALSLKDKKGGPIHHLLGYNSRAIQSNPSSDIQIDSVRLGEQGIFQQRLFNRAYRYKSTRHVSTILLFYWVISGISFPILLIWTLNQNTSFPETRRLRKAGQGGDAPRATCLKSFSISR